MHERTKFRLHSHEVPYGSGSGQQSVTGFPTGDDSNSYWVIDTFACAFSVLWWVHLWYSLWYQYLETMFWQTVKPVPGSTAKQGDTIKSGTDIRLQHMKTHKWLHSHLHASPISGNLEVTW